MSYSRFGWDDSDVYVYLDVGGYLCCCACNLNFTRPEALFPANQREYTTAQMVAHLQRHTADGQCVPDDCIESLTADAPENDAWILDAIAERWEAS